MASGPGDLATAGTWVASPASLAYRRFSVTLLPSAVSAWRMSSVSRACSGPADGARPVGERGENQRAVGHGLGAGDGDPGADRARRLPGWPGGSPGRSRPPPGYTCALSIG